MSSTSLYCNIFGGISKQDATFSSKKITASDLQNVELYDTGINSGVGIRTAKGNTLVCNLIPESEKVINLFQSVQKSKTYFFVHTETETEGKIYLFIPNSNILQLKVDRLTPTGKSTATDFAQGWSDLFVFSNGEDILTIELEKYNEKGELDEIKKMDLTDRDGRSVKGLGVLNFNGRLWIFNDNVLWYSVQQNIYDFSTANASIVTSAGYIEFVKKITAITIYVSSIAVFHQDSSCLVNYDSSGNFSVSEECPGGCAGYNAFVFHGTELYFYDDTKKGIFSFNQSVLGNKTLGKNIALNMQEELCNISSNFSEIRMLSVVLSDRNEFWFLLPTNDTEYSTILIYDYKHQEWIKRVCPKITCFQIINNTLYSGDAKGKIYQEYIGNDFHGLFVKSFYKTSPLNFGIDNMLKILFIPPKIGLDLSFANNFYVEYIKNYDSLKKPKRRNIIAKSMKNALYWDTGFYDKFFYAPENANSYYKLPSEIFRTLELHFYTQNEGQDFCIRNLEFTHIKLKPMY